MLPPLKFAKLSAVALSDSLKISKHLGRQYITQALEFETWDRYVSKSASQPPDEFDDKLSPDIANNRLGAFTENLANIIGLNEMISSELAKSITPFSGRKPKAYRVDKDMLIKDDESIDLHEMMEMAGGKEGMRDFLNSIAESDPSLAHFKDMDIDDFENRMRISHPMNPGCFYDFLENFTDWELDDTFYEEDYEYLEASFHLVSSFDGVSYPVYLLSCSGVPGDSNDSLFENIKCNLAVGGRALILFRLPIYKELNGVTYAVIGTFYNGSNWSWTLLMEDDPEAQSKVITAKNFDLESPIPDKKYGVMDIQGIEGHIIYQHFISGACDYTTGKMQMPKKAVVVSGVGGWANNILS